jgi:hypothetical protein
MSLLTDASLIVTPNAYKASKLYSVIPNTVLGDMNIVRATTATRVNSAGLIESVAINVPRLDYTLGSCPSILVEPQKTNSLTYSNQFDNGIWTKNSVIVTANAAISPEGYANAKKLISTAVSGFHSLTQLTSKSALTPYTFSFFAKADEIGFCIPNFSNTFSGTQLLAQVNLTNGAVALVSAGLSASTQNYGNGWFRVILTATSQNNTLDFMVTINTTDAAGNANHTGNGTSGILIYGAQLEIGSSPTSYIPTIAAIATRNADVISKTGISSLIGPTEGTIYAEINNTLMTYSATGYVMRIFADANNEVWIRKESGSNKYTAKWRANSVDVYTQSNISVLNGNNKIAIAYKTGNSAVYLNGTQIGTSASTGAFAVAPSQIGIGSSSTADFFNDRIELATVFPTRLTNAQLATLTTL